MSDAHLSVTGNLTRDPELRYTQSGMQVASFGLAVNHRRKNQTGDYEDETSFIDVVCFGGLAENAAESLTKGTRALVAGRLRVRTYDRRDGGQGTAVEVVADEVGPSLRWATAQLERVNRNGGGGGSTRTDGPSGPAPAYADDEEPFHRPVELGDL